MDFNTFINAVGQRMRLAQRRDEQGKPVAYIGRVDWMELMKERDSLQHHYQGNDEQGQRSEYYAGALVRVVDCDRWLHVEILHTGGKVGVTMDSIVGLPQGAAHEAVDWTGHRGILERGRRGRS